MMHGSNGSSGADRYLPMDYGMHHHNVPHPTHQAPPPGHPHHDPHLAAAAAAHYALPPSHHNPLAPPPGGMGGTKRSPESAGLDMMSAASGAGSSDEEGSEMHDVKPVLGDRAATGRGTALKGGGEGPPAGKKTKGRVKIKMEFIDNKLRRYTTFSKRKTGIMKKAYELSTLTGTQVMLLVASETGHVYTFATRKLQPMITSDAGKALIQTCLNSPDPPQSSAPSSDQRMSASGYEETELTYNAITDAAAAAAAEAAEQQKEYTEDNNEEEEEEELEEQEEDLEEEEQEIQIEHKSILHKYKTLEQASKQGASSSGALFSTTSSQVVGLRQHPVSTSMASSSNSNLPPEVISQLLATGHLVREDGTLVRLTSIPHHHQPGTSSTIADDSTVTITPKDLSKKSNPSS